jgi:hypothetical protein
MKRIAIALLLSSAFAATVGAQTTAVQTGPVGTFDKTAIVIAYYNSPQWQATIQEKHQEKDAATKANDTAKAKALEEWGQASQELAMQQLTGNAPIDNILEALQPAFKDIESSLHLGSIVASPSPDASAATVDVTAQLLDWLHADARTRKWISDAKQQGAAAH